MKLFVFLLFLVNASVCQAQEFEFSVVDDQDGFVNVRSSSSVDNNIVDKLENGFVLHHFEKEGNWTRVYYRKNEKSINGYIYSDRLKRVTDFDDISKKSQSENSIAFSNGNIEVRLVKTKFNKEERSFEYYDDNNPSLIKKIDGKEFWGFNNPKIQYKAITISINKSEINLPQKAIDNLYSPSLFNTSVFYNNRTQTIYIQSFNGDGAAAYAVLWVIEKGKYRNRVIERPF